MMIHEDDAALAKALDDRTIVDDLVIDVQRRAEDFESAFQALDGHVHAGTKAARIGENDFHDYFLLVACIVAFRCDSRYASAQHIRAAVAQRYFFRSRTRSKRKSRPLTSCAAPHLSE